MISGLIVKVEKTANEEAVVNLVNSAWPDIKIMPQANDPKNLLNEIMMKIWEMKHEQSKKKQKGKPKKEEDKRQKIDVEALLDRIQSSILLDEFERTLKRIHSDIITILSRTYCYTVMVNQDKNLTDIAKAFGSKAEKNLSSSSIIQNPKTMYKLIVEFKMYRLTQIAPARDDLHLLLTHSSEIQEYLETNQKAKDFWCNGSMVLKLDWFLGSNN